MNTGNIYLEHYGKVYGFLLVKVRKDSEKQVRKDSVLLTFTITDFLFILSFHTLIKKNVLRQQGNTELVK